MSALTEGSIIAGRYRLGPPLAKGGMGSVFFAEHLQLRTGVAVKLMAPALAASADARARFEREAQASAVIKSPNVVQVYDYGVEGDCPYIVMELLDGEDLERRLVRVGRLSLEATLDIVQQVCKALRRAHKLGLVHRDLKPANLFFARNGDEELVKILDFGIAKANGPVLAGNATRTGTLIGSPQYMSPEQVRRGKEVDPRSDLWSLGVIAYRCVTGRLPFLGEEIGDLLVEICTDPIPAPSSIHDALGPDVDWFFERALTRDVNKRFQSAGELADAFAAVVSGSGPISMSTSSQNYALGPPSEPGAVASSQNHALGPTPAPGSVASSQNHALGPTPAPGAAAVGAPGSASGAGGTLSPSGLSLAQSPASKPRTIVVAVSIALAASLAVGLGAFAWSRSSAQSEPVSTPESEGERPASSEPSPAGTASVAAPASVAASPSDTASVSGTASASGTAVDAKAPPARPVKGAVRPKKGTKTGHDPLDHQ
ncbi:protein kinase [Polyangium jinanense]|uniref:serine/threonine protein kinase n=1 Tax=Polyangium jinanense TaxID=2829994 RepID=UPI0023412573|nr:serine/threonine-protein kinase [Polyangium jinanense]MDC3960930.1 protein kinase [Polyangium jinanense]